jgi:AraC-like DNA-binding protein
MSRFVSDNLIKIELKNIALSRFDRDSKYDYVISAFSRIYFITEGKGWLQIGDKRITLKPGFLYLVPSFVPCSYYFEKQLEHYYIHFSAHLLNGLNIYSLFKTSSKVSVNKLDKELFERLLELNPGMKLPSLDPDIYQKKDWLSKSIHNQPLSHIYETRAIIEQLLSRFIMQKQNSAQDEIVRHRLNPIFSYIQSHLTEVIHIEKLAKMTFLSPDHFIRVFKKVVGIPPGEFIISKRVEKAKLLLLTTNKPIKLVFEESGFKSLQYFSRVFKKHTSLSPTEYRKMKA